MMATFCDGCGDEITETNEATGGNVSESRLGTEVKSKNGRCKLKVELITSRDGVSNAGDFCKYCIIDAFVKLDNRDKPAS